MVQKYASQAVPRREALVEQFLNTVTENFVPMFVGFSQASIQAIENEFAGAVILFSLALISAVLARSALLFIPTATLAVFSILSTDASAGSYRLVPLLLGPLALAILCAWTIAIRRRFARLKNRLRASLEDLAATKKSLDREVEWRQAAEDEKLA